MEKNPPVQEKQAVSNVLESSTEGPQGATLSPPAFQLMASPDAPPIQRHADEHGEYDENSSWENASEASPQGDFPWDGLAQNATSVYKNAAIDVANILAPISMGDVVKIIGEKDTFYEVKIGRKQGFVTKTSLKQVNLRLSRNDDLLEVLRGKKTIKAGESGVGVTIVQQIVAEATVIILAYLNALKKVGIDVKAAEQAINGGKAGLLSGAVNGQMDPVTVTIVKGIQSQNGIPGAGEINQATLFKINDVLLKKAYLLEAGELWFYQFLADAPLGTEYTKANTPAELLTHTRNISTAEQTAFESAINTEPKLATGPLKKDIGGVTYEQALTKEVEERILWYYDKLGKGKGDLHKKQENLQDWGQIGKVAEQSKGATDAKFGKYRRGNALDTSKIKDGWDMKEKALQNDASLAEEWIEWRVEKIMTMHDNVKALDLEYSALQSRAEEAKIILRVKKALKKKYRKELIEIHKGWPANADGGTVNIQIFKEKDATGQDDFAKNRDFMWRLFNTLIHEYIHTLEHTEHQNYRGNMDGQKGGHVLREGITDYFTKIVYNNTDKTNKSLRQAVEGPFHDPKVDHPLPNMGAYGESQNAEAAAAVIGFANMCAAFFLGRTDLYKHV